MNQGIRRRPFAGLVHLWKTSSLRTQLVVMTSGLMLLAVTITAILTASLFRQEAVRKIDEDLFLNRNDVSYFLLSSMSTASDYTFSPQSILRFYGEIQDNEGTVQVTTTAQGAEVDTPVVPEFTAAQAVEHGSQAFEVDGTAADSDGWRVSVYRLETGQGTLVIGLPLEPVHSSGERVTTLVATIGLLGTLVASVISSALATRAFRPLLRVERTAAQIAAGDLSRRVDNAPPDTEVGRLSRSLNAMLTHIESAFRAKDHSEQRMRRFVQDASHELRTPLVTIRGFSELYRHGGITREEDVATAMGRIESEAKRMGQLVDDLLTLARLDEQRALEHQRVDLLMLAHDSVLDTQVQAPDRVVTLVGLDGGRARSAPTLGDEGRLRQVLVNLVTNALRYTPEGTPLEIAVGTVDVLLGSVDAAGRSEGGSRDSVIEVRDHGHGVSEEDAARIFERFYRSDSSRDRETGGTGLGLAIVQAIVAQHQGVVRVRETPGGGATFSVRLPWLATPADEQEDESVDESTEVTGVETSAEGESGSALSSTDAEPTETVHPRGPGRPTG